MINKYKSVDIFGLQIQKITIQNVIEEIKLALNEKRTLTITAINPHKANQVYEKPSLKKIYNSFVFLTPDSVGVLLAARILGNPLKGERISGDAIASQLYLMAKNNNIKLFLLGGEDDVAKQAANKIIDSYPWVKIVGYHHGYFEDKENSKIISLINESRANIVFVGLGSRLKAEKWILSNVYRLKSCILINQGGYFDHVLRRIDCYPKWVTKLKINWLYRLYKEPRRLWKRYLIGIPKFIFRIIKYKLGLRRKILINIKNLIPQKSSIYLGIKLSKMTRTNVIDMIESYIAEQKQLTMSYCGFHTVNIIGSDTRNKYIFQSLDFLFPDGISILWTSHWFGKRMNKANRINGDAFVPYLIPKAIANKWKIYLLGGKHGVAELAAVKLKQAFPGLVIAGTHHGYFHSAAQEQKLIHSINQSEPTIVLVGMDQPHQEEWILNNKSLIEVPVIMGVGGYFDHVLRRIDCYPKWITKLKINWAYRLYKEPRRLW